jgi:hypothetical protein
VAEGSLGRAEVTHVNLNDGVIEGIRSSDVPAFSVQHHPEAGPGPHDAAYLFGEFMALLEHVRTGRAVVQVAGSPYMAYETGPVGLAEHHLQRSVTDSAAGAGA